MNHEPATPSIADSQPDSAGENPDTPLTPLTRWHHTAFEFDDYHVKYHLPLMCKLFNPSTHDHWAPALRRLAND